MFSLKHPDSRRLNQLHKRAPYLGFFSNFNTKELNIFVYIN